MSLARTDKQTIAPGYGRSAVFGNHALLVDFNDEVAVGALFEHGGELDLTREECDRIIRNVRNGRTDPWNP